MYDSKRLIPAPFVTFNKVYNKTGDGQLVGSTFSISLKGTIVSYKGSPTTTGTFWTSGGYPNDEVLTDEEGLKAIIRKQEAIRDLFSTEGLTLEVQSADGSQPMKCNPRLVSIDFTDGLWYNRCEYTIQLEADIVYVNGTELGEDNFTQNLAEASETWSIETNEDQAESVEQNRTYRLSHSVSATGRRFYDDTGLMQKDAWKWARDWVVPKLGFDATIALSSGVNSLPSYYGGFNHVRNEEVGESTGSFSVSETWILASGNVLEDFTVETSTNATEGITTVSIQGNITGLEVRDSNMQVTTSKYTAANTKLAAITGGLAYSRATSYSGQSLNILPAQSTISKNPTAGNITYNYTYDTRPGNIVTDTKSESFTVTRSWDVDIVASIPVLGRTAGPVLQPINTHQESTVNLDIQLVFGPEFAGTGTNPTTLLVTRNPGLVEPQRSQIQTIVDAVKPSLAGYLNNAGQAATVQYVRNQTENWEPRNGRYGLQIEWVYE
jgi:hypothetical protein